jgi:hypothetical protein
MKTWIKTCGLLAGLAATVMASAPGFAASAYTYTYTGPDFTGQTAHLVITLTVPNPLAPSTTYSGLPTGTTNATIAVAGATGVGAFSLPIGTFAVSTDGGGNIASWFILADSNVASGPAPLTDIDHQAYSINTLSTTVPIPGGITGHFAYDQATVVDFYSTCAGVPGCVLAGNGQPYVSAYGGIVNPAAGTWKASAGSGHKHGGGGEDSGKN